MAAGAGARVETRGGEGARKDVRGGDSGQGAEGGDAEGPQREGRDGLWRAAGCAGALAGVALVHV